MNVCSRYGFGESFVLYVYEAGVVLLVVFLNIWNFWVMVVFKWSIREIRDDIRVFAIAFGFVRS